MGRRVKKPVRSPSRRAGKVLYRAAVAVSAVIVVLYCVFLFLSRPPEYKQPGAPALTAPTDDPYTEVDESRRTPAPTPTPRPAMVRKEQTYTFLLVASDQVSGSTDTMMVLTYDTLNQRAGLVSLPRDTMIDGVRESNGKGFYKLNGMYAYNGIEALKAEAGNLLGFPIDYYVKVNTRGFVRLVDAVGGIDFYVPVRMSYDAPDQDLHIHYEKGMQWLSGADALKVARCRQNSDGEGEYPHNLYDVYAGADIGRTDTQRSMLVTVLKKALSKPHKFAEYYDIFLENVSTDMNLQDLVFFASRATQFDFAGGLSANVLPGDGSVRYHGWSWCYELDPQGVLDIVNNGGLNPYTTEITRDMLHIAQAD